jgi:DNA-binding transcriptional MerR regulator
MSKLSISEAAKLKGVSVSTLRRWESEGKLIPERTPSGHRRYDLYQFNMKLHIMIINQLLSLNSHEPPV